MKKTVSQILQEGRARIDAGWCQGAIYALTSHGERQYCAMGAILSAWYPQDLVAAKAAMDSLLRALPGAWDTCGVGAYNDAPERTKQDILALYDRALTEVTK